MKAIQYTQRLSGNIINLFYSTCTNDLILYSKQASNIEVFVLAFLIEYNRLFIADSIFMNTIEKNVLVKFKTFLATKKSSYINISTEIKNEVYALFYNNPFGEFIPKGNFTNHQHN